MVCCLKFISAECVEVRWHRWVGSGQVSSLHRRIGEISRVVFQLALFGLILWNLSRFGVKEPSWIIVRADSGF